MMNYFFEVSAFFNLFYWWDHFPITIQAYNPHYTGQPCLSSSAQTLIMFCLISSVAIISALHPCTSSLRVRGLFGKLVVAGPWLQDNTTIYIGFTMRGCTVLKWYTLQLIDGNEVADVAWFIAVSMCNTKDRHLGQFNWARHDTHRIGLKDC